MIQRWYNFSVEGSYVSDAGSMVAKEYYVVAITWGATSGGSAARPSNSLLLHLHHARLAAFHLLEVLRACV